MSSLSEIIEKLKQNQVVAYPTEAVFGLGCNPQSENAVRALLALKQRDEAKGLILIAPDLDLLTPYIDISGLNMAQRQHLEQVGEQAITWIVPANTNLPRYLTGKFDTIAVRLCRLPAVVALCEATGFALTSTSANLSGLPPCREASEVRVQFGNDFPVLDAPTGGRQNPSEIRDIFSNHILRQG